MSAKEWSPQQVAIFDEVRSGKGNVVVRARAGTGKTTTIEEAITHAKERNILLAAFNKKIALELGKRIRNPNAVAKTLHSIGFGRILQNWDRVEIDEDRSLRLAAQAIKGPKAIHRLVKRIAAVGKNVNPNATAQQLEELSYVYNIVIDDEELEERFTQRDLAEAAEWVMQASTQFTGTIDFDDMIYLPVKMGWVNGRYDLVVIDEAQDMNPTQLMLAKKLVRPMGRIMVVGDDKQAIYGFRGADSNALDNLKKELKAKEFGLTITYRCPKAVVERAKQLVPDFHAAATAPEGLVQRLNIDKVATKVQPKDFILSRTNAPLAKMCMSLLKNRIRARIEGRDIGRSMVSLIRRLHSETMEEMLLKLGTWEQLECGKAANLRSESAMAARQEFVIDQAATIRALAEDLVVVEELVTRIEELFDDDVSQTPAVVCSSIHRSKGLETDRVFLLTDTLYPGGRTHVVEEQNIHYVGITRAKKELYNVFDPSNER